jgi:hypothetical protein
MLGEEVADEIERLQIAVLNRSSLINRLAYQVEDAQLKANGLRQWVLDLMKENAALRQQLGMASLNPPHLPPRYPDSALAKALGATRTSEADRTHYFIPPPAPAPDLPSWIPTVK